MISLPNAMHEIASDVCNQRDNRSTHSGKTDLVSLLPYHFTKAYFSILVTRNSPALLSSCEDWVFHDLGDTPAHHTDSHQTIQPDHDRDLL
jgi:hypothetical protein